MMLPALLTINAPVSTILIKSNLGKYGFLDYHRHTGNSLPYLKEAVK